MNVLVLESVGSCVDTDGMVYPLNIDNTPDLNCGTDFINTTDEWSESLSEEDAGLLDAWLIKIDYSVEQILQKTITRNYEKEQRTL